MSDEEPDFSLADLSALAKVEKFLAAAKLDAEGASKENIADELGISTSLATAYVRKGLTLAAKKELVAQESARTIMQLSALIEAHLPRAKRDIYLMAEVGKLIDKKAKLIGGPKRVDLNVTHQGEPGGLGFSQATLDEVNKKRQDILDELGLADPALLEGIRESARIEEATIIDETDEEEG